MSFSLSTKAGSRELLIKLDRFGIIGEISSNCLGILGHSDTEILNTKFTNYFNYTFKNLQYFENFNLDFLRKDGCKLFFDVHSTPLIVNNKIEGRILSLIEISKYKEIKDDQNTILKILERTKDIVCRFEIIPEPKFTYLSPSVQQTLGYKVDEFINNPMFVFEIIHPDDVETQLSKVRSDTDFSKFFQVRFKHKDGYYVWLEDYIIPCYNEANEYVACESITRNIQERKELEQRLEKLGYNDYMTGLFNKNYFLKEINLLNNISMPIGIIVCDLDNLKYINDSLGHSSGDNLIKNTAKVLQSVFNSNHIISRTGGDEFVIIIKNKCYNDVENLYEELKISIDKFNKINNDVPIEISMGLAYSNSSLNTVESILDTADSNMYIDKINKKENHISYYKSQKSR